MSMHFNIALFVSMFWPFVFVAVAWGVSVWALRQPDPQAELVRRFTGAAMRPDGRRPPEAGSAQRKTPKSPQP